MSRAMLTAAAVIVATAWLNVHGAKPQVYRNQEFGIVLPVPASAVRCPISENEHDQGPVFLLGTSSTMGCGDVERYRYIEVFAGYNEAYVTKDLPSLLKWDCKYLAKGHCGAAPSDLRIAGLRSLDARVDRPDGWIYIIVVTQAGKPDSAFDPSVPSVNYNLSLHTRPQNLEGDLRAFRRVLQTIRLSPPNE